MRFGWGAAVVLLCTGAQAQQAVDQKRVDAAIQKGVAHLRGRLPEVERAPRLKSGMKPTELILLTLIHAGVPPGDADWQRLFKTMMADPLERTYMVSLQAMVLEELDRVKYQWRLRQCAQFLIDNQCGNGQWAYGEPVDTRDVATGHAEPPASYHKEKPKVAKRIEMKRRGEPPRPGGDNSNSQYAALGLRAAHDAGVLIPKETLQLAQKWWRSAPYSDGGWGYGPKNAATHDSYQSMTAGAVGALAIYDTLLGEPWRKDAALQMGIEWMGVHFSTTANSGPPAPPQRPWSSFMMYYCLYAVSRTGNLLKMDKFGTHDWYSEGATAILDAQLGNGSWLSKDEGKDVPDTCFAILFLRRAIRPLEDVATGDNRKR